MTQLEYGTYYHIYNRGNNKIDVFKDEKDYQHFLFLIQKYLLTVADIFCYALMKNHFHLLARIKESKDIDFLAPDYLNEPSKKWETIQQTEIDHKTVDEKKLKKPVPYRQFSHLFNSYTKWFNKRHRRTGSLFEKNFRRKEITSEEYLKQVLYYIHHNPLHHGFCTSYNVYPWTSYQFYTENRLSFIDKQTVLEWFSDLESFTFFHQEEHNLSMIDSDF